MGEKKEKQRSCYANHQRGGANKKCLVVTSHAFSGVV